MLPIVRGADPVLRKVVDCAPLVVPTRCALKLRLDGVRLTAGAARAPAPLSPAVCGLPVASSVTTTLAARFPVALGENVIETVHDVPAARVPGAAGQSFDCVKSSGLAPARPTLAIVSGAEPEFVSVIVFAALVVPSVWLAKLRLVGKNVTAGAAPDPLNPRLCGLPGASSVIATLAVRLPVAVGENVTEMVHVAPAASVDGLNGQSVLRV